MSDVRISGFGIVSVFGAGSAALVRGLRRGEAALGPLTAFASAASPVKVSQLDRERFPADEAGTEAMVLAAIHEALAEAGGRDGSLADCALVCGGTNALALAEQAYRRLLADAPGTRPPVHDPGYLAPQLARRLGIAGPALTINTACSSSANALLVARDLIARGQVRRALVLGVESLSAITLSGFQSLMLLDPDGCRPFDAARRGLQLGEGAAALVLERAEEGECDFILRGGANLCDIHHVTSASPDGSGMARCMQQALASAGVPADRIVAIKAHGTGSVENDAAEVVAMKTVFGERMPPFTGLKRYVGHTLGACGAIETVATLASLREGFVPASAGFRKPDAELGASPITTPLPARPGDYLLNFFGFGGNYAALVISHG